MRAAPGARPGSAEKAPAMDRSGEGGPLTALVFALTISKVWPSEQVASSGHPVPREIW
jgi:hypothetical protein